MENTICSYLEGIVYFLSGLTSVVAYVADERVGIIHIYRSFIGPKKE